jgi:hypothetical protein
MWIGATEFETASFNEFQAVILLYLNIDLATAYISTQLLADSNCLFSAVEKVIVGIDGNVLWTSASAV